ncbi:hypothetical protein CPB97_002121 [Podila verticillata]|nr:hypothetical protein CPB97_002121 [Podila verticillata]
MTAAERCMSLAEIINKIIGLLDHNDQLNCLCINTTWHNIALTHVLRRALYIEREDHPGVKQYFRRVVALISDPLAQQSLLRNSSYIRHLYIGEPDLPSLLTAHLTRLTSLVLVLDRFSMEQHSMVASLIRKNPNLCSIAIDWVSNMLDLYELSSALQTCKGLMHFYLDSFGRFFASNCRARPVIPDNYQSGVDWSALKALVQGLACSHSGLRSLSIHTRLINTAASDWSLLEASESSDKLFPDLENLLIRVVDENLMPIDGDAMFLPLLREAPAVTALKIPCMSATASAAAVAIVKEHGLHLSSLTFGEILGGNKMYPDCFGFVDLVTTNSRTLHTLRASQVNPSIAQSMMLALLPNQGPDIDIRTNLRVLTLGLQEGPIVSALINRILTTLPNLQEFQMDQFTNVLSTVNPARLQIRDMQSPWACLRLETLSIYLGCRTADEGQTETVQERRIKIAHVYEQFGALTRLKYLDIASNVLGGPLNVEFDFTLSTGLQAMKPCLQSLKTLNIIRVGARRFSNRDNVWLKAHAPHLRRSPNPEHFA